ncbi:tetratricopeptide repeat protein [Parahaliea mediterranea]|uniref:tetratricopeptide repeat protein n=1 Tax=Parahaliea mediterranea TaxID=651086 RepID=UPI0013008E0B|nr:tetratricopeptide repeat protein [Parahaliea mediterranea]
MLRALPSALLRSAQQAALLPGRMAALVTALVTVFGAALLAACSPAPDADANRPTPAAPVTISGKQVEMDYWVLKQRHEQHLATLAQALEDSRAARATGPARALFEGWLYHARLTGQLASFDHAEAALAELEARSRGEPPCREQAELAMASHRIEAAARALQACPGADNRDLLIDIDYYQGRYRAALDSAVALLNERNLPADYVRLARLRQGTGSTREADALLEAAEQRYHNDNPHQLAWLGLQRGILALERGEYQRARALFRRAQRALPDWWLVDEHLAETQMLLGDTDAAIALYDQVIDITGDPQFIAARADIDRRLGRETTALTGITRARAALQIRLEQHPAATTGHAVDFYLDHGPAQQALALAWQDYRQRPFGAAATRLARALHKVGEHRQALDILSAEVDAGWGTAEALQTLALIRGELASAPAGGGG